MKFKCSKHLKENKKLVAVALIAVITISVGVAIWLTTQALGKPSQYQLWYLVYDDGNSRPIVPTSLPTGAWVDPVNNKGVVKVKVQLHMILAYTGNAMSYSVTGAAAFELRDATTNTKLADIGTINPVPLSGNVPPSGSDIVIYEGEVQTNALSSMYAGWQTGKEYYLVVTSTSTMQFQLTFATGNTKTVAVRPDDAAWKFRYESDESIMSLQLTWGIDQQYAPTSCTLTVSAWAGGYAVEGVQVSVDGNVVGQTSWDGTFSTIISAGVHTVAVQSPIGFMGEVWSFDYWENSEGSNPRTILVADNMDISAWYRAGY